MNNEMTQPSPKVINLSWGSIATEAGEFRDAKLWPGGGRNWDWNETGTHHQPGVQPVDVEEILDKNPEILIIGCGQNERLQVMDETIKVAEDQEVELEILESNQAVERYNQMVEDGRDVSALIHTTC